MLGKNVCYIYFFGKKVTCLISQKQSHISEESR